MHLDQPIQTCGRSYRGPSGLYYHMHTVHQDYVPRHGIYYVQGQNRPLPQSRHRYNMGSEIKTASRTQQTNDLKILTDAMEAALGARSVLPRVPTQSESASVPTVAEGDAAQVDVSQQVVDESAQLPQFEMPEKVEAVLVIDQPAEVVAEPAVVVGASEEHVDEVAAEPSEEAVYLPAHAE